MLKAYSENFEAYVKNALYDHEERAFFLEFVGLSGTDSICASALSNKIISIPKKNLDFRIFRHGTRLVFNETGKQEKKHLLNWKWKRKSYGPIRHTILYPEGVVNNHLEDAPWPRVVMGQSEEEARDQLWRFLNNTLDIPIPEDRNLKFFTEMLQVAVEGGKDDILEAIQPLKHIGEVRGFVIYSPSLLEEILRDFYSFLIKKKEIFLRGEEVKLEGKTLEVFLDYWGKPLTQKVIKNFRPLYEAGKGLSEIDEKISRLYRKPFPAQREAINSLFTAFFKHGHKRAVLCGEQGTGKTFMALALIGVAPKPMRVLVVCPPHLVPKWAREARETIPSVKTVTLNDKKALKKLRTLQKNKKPLKSSEIWIIGREKLKLSCPWKPAVIPGKVKGKVVPLPGRQAGETNEIFLCPDCFYPIFQTNKNEKEEVVPATWKWLSRARRKCSNCGAPLWQPDTSRFRRYAPAEFIKKKLRGVFDLVVVDECHEYKAQNTAQANAVGALLSACSKALFLTGTLMGGYATDVFYLYFRAFPEEFKRDGWEWTSGTSFMKRYGVLEEVEVIKEVEDNRTSRGRKSRKVFMKARPGVSPEVLAKFLLPHTVFVRLEDMATELPSYEEVYVAVDRGNEDNGEYERCKEAYQDAIKGLQSTQARLAIASKFVSVLMNLPDCVRHLENTIKREVFDEDGKFLEEVLLHKTEIIPGGPLSKERWLAELIQKERKAGRKVLVYCTYTGEKDITRRLASVLSKDFGLKATVLPSSISTDKREEWIRKNAISTDVLICNPKLVETGLDLFDFPTVVFYQPGYRIYTLRQAARRSWRLGQKKPVKVFFLAAEGTVQEDAWALIAQKWNVSSAVEGELITEGFATEFDSGGSILGELSKKLAEGTLGQASADEVFRRLKLTEAQANNFILSQPQPQIFEVEKVTTELREVQKRPKPKTVIISVGQKCGKKKIKWIRMEVQPEDLQRIKKKGQPIQLALF